VLLVSGREPSPVFEAVERSLSLPSVFVGPMSFLNGIGASSLLAPSPIEPCESSFPGGGM
jgi:hypothetical protein